MFLYNIFLFKEYFHRQQVVSPWHKFKKNLYVTVYRTDVMAHTKKLLVIKQENEFLLQFEKKSHKTSKTYSIRIPACIPFFTFPDIFLYSETFLKTSRTCDAKIVSVNSVVRFFNATLQVFWQLSLYRRTVMESLSTLRNSDANLYHSDIISRVLHILQTVIIQSNSILSEQF